MAARTTQKVQAVLPEHVDIHSRAVALAYYGSPELVYADAIKKFSAVRPWTATPPLPWASPAANDTVVDMLLSGDVVMQVNEAVQAINDADPFVRVDARTFVSTAICWLCEHVYRDVFDKSKAQRKPPMPLH